MFPFLRVLLVMVLVAALAVPAWPQGRAPLPPPLPPQVAPGWTPAPGNPYVLYAPNIPGNLFRYRHKYYYFYGGVWYRGKTPHGPWKRARKVPRVLLNLPPTAFK